MVFVFFFGCVWIVGFNSNGLVGAKEHAHHNKIFGTRQRSKFVHMGCVQQQCKTSKIWDVNAKKKRGTRKEGRTKWRAVLFDVGICIGR